MTIVPVILAGGIGERFWPLSRSSMPKQLLSIVSTKTMAEETLSRVDSLCSKNAKPLIITNKTIAQKLKSAISSKWQYDLIVEAVGKNTAPPIALAAAWIEKKYGESVMVVLSADHDIRPQKAFIHAVKYAASLAYKSNNLVVFGIKPSRPETGYGYIQLGEKTDSNSNAESFSVKGFVEKPDLKKAKNYLKTKKYMWNSGMFVWKTSVILEEFSQYMPQIFDSVQNLSRKKFTKKAIDEFYIGCTKESIDYGIMEKSRRVNAVVGKFVWDDIGSWESISRLHGQSSSGTTLFGSQIFEKKSTNSIVVNKSKTSVAAIGLNNSVLVVTDDAILVIDRSELPDIKKYLSEMKKEGNFPEKLF